MAACPRVLITGVLFAVALYRTAGADDAAATAAAEGEDHVEATEAAGSSQPQVPTFRGGSLGMPSLGAGEVAQAAAVGKVASGEAGGGAAVDFNFFTKVGGLNLYDTIFADIIGESYDQAIPQAVVGMTGALPTMVPTTITSAGIRLKYRFKVREFKVLRYDELARGTGTAAPDKDALVNVTARQIFAGRTGQALTFGLRMLHPGVPGADTDRIAGMSSELIFQRTTSKQATGDQITACTKGEQQPAAAASTPAPGTTTETDAPIAAGGAVDAEDDAAIESLLGELRSASGTDGDGSRVASIDRLTSLAEIERKEATTATGKVNSACQNGDRIRTWYISLSGTYLNSQRLTAEGGMQLALPSFREVRASAGIEVQAGKEEIGLLLPRVGTYLTVSRGAWTNDFATASQTAEPHAWQLELAVYASGHFAGGFSGLLSFGVLLPYGHDDEPQGFINISPSIGTSLGGGS